MPVVPAREPEAARAIWIVVATLLAILTIEAATFAVLHRSDADILRTSLDATDSDWMRAVHIRSQRDEPELWTRSDVEALLASDDARVREFALTHGFARAEGADAQSAYIEAESESARERLFFRFHQRTMKREHVDDYFADSYSNSDSR